MRALVIRQFTMGDSRYQADQIIDLPDDRVNRLIGEGLVERLPEPQSTQPKKTITDPVPNIPDVGAPPVVKQNKSKKRK